MTRPRPLELEKTSTSPQLEAGDPVRRSGLRIGLWVAFGLWTAVTLVFSSTAVQQDGSPLLWLPGFVGVGVTGALLSLPLLYAGAALGSARSRWRFVGVALVGLAAAAIQSVTDAAVLRAASHFLQPELPVPGDWGPAIRFNMILYIWIYALYGTAVVLVFVALNARAAEQRLLRVQAAADRARLESLRLQINPHFLFNSLNAAVSLIGLDRGADAEAVLLGLSDLFRSSLASPSDAIVSLAEEFEIVDAYLQIESIRFGDRLTVALDLPVDLRRAAWPHFLLQPLVENAIKHGVAMTSRPTSVRVTAADEEGFLVVLVENDRATDETSVGHGIGLQNTRERLAAHYGDRAGLRTSSVGGKFIAEIRIPLTAISSR